MFTQKYGIVSCLSVHASLIHHVNFITFVLDPIFLKQDDTSTTGNRNARLISCYTAWFLHRARQPEEETILHTIKTQRLARALNKRHHFTYSVIEFFMTGYHGLFIS